MLNTELTHLDLCVIDKSGVSLSVVSRIKPTASYVLFNDDDVVDHLLTLIDKSKISPGTACVINLDQDTIVYRDKSTLIQSPKFCESISRKDYERISETPVCDIPIILQSGSARLRSVIYIASAAMVAKAPERTYPNLDIVRKLTFLVCADAKTLSSGVHVTYDRDRNDVYSTEVQLVEQGRSGICARYINIGDATHTVVTRVWRTS